MTHHCPKCGHNINEQAKTCPACDNSLGAVETMKKTDVKQTENENIEWSELKDMSLGHVMNMFHEQTDDAEIKNESKIVPSDTEQKKTEKEASSETNLSVAGISEVSENPTLQEYLETHRLESNEDNKTNDDTKQVEATDTINSTSDQKQSFSEENITEKPIKDLSVSEIKAFEIPSNSQKPEEIEMDAVPIFFKEEQLQTDETDTIANTDPETTKKSNYKKFALISASLIVLGGGTWWSAQNIVNKPISKAAVGKQKTDPKILDIKKELASYFTSDKQIFLKPQMIDVSTKKIQEQLETLQQAAEYATLNQLIHTINDKQKKIQTVNQLFMQPIIDGDHLKDVALAADQPVSIKKYPENDPFDQLMNQAIDRASNQYHQLQEAKQAVSEIIIEDNLTSIATINLIIAAQDKVNAIKNDALKKPLLNKLSEADRLLTLRDEEQSINSSDKDKALKDQAVNSPSEPNANGIYTAPFYAENPNDLADGSNPAWIWEAGIQEKVIATSLQRGYIVEEGYILKPACIVDGEGYYNLYATKKSPLLPNLSSEDAPVYLVTINAKTGWFKGNASRNAGR